MKATPGLNPAVGSADAPEPEAGRLETSELEAMLDDALGQPAAAPKPRGKAEDAYAGLVVDQRYVVEKLLAEGGMGRVYQCRHKILGKKLAIKIIRADVAELPEAPQRFLLEAKAASAVGNEHIIDIIDFGALSDGAAYLVMEFLEGSPLSALIEGKSGLPGTRILTLASQIAEGLGAAHQAGIVHRDLKPANIFVIDRKGEDFIKVLDFGVAQMAHAATSKLTQAGVIIGTPHYMSPEQILGGQIDHRSDIYALGVIMYELAAGYVPFNAEHYLAILHQHLHLAPRPFTSLSPSVQVSPGLEAIIFRCLAKQPEQRYASMAEVRRELDAVAHGRAPRGTLIGHAPVVPVAGLVAGSMAGGVSETGPHGATRMALEQSAKAPDLTGLPTLVLPAVPASRPRGMEAKGRARRRYLGTAALLALLCVIWFVAAGGQRKAGKVAWPDVAVAPGVTESRPVGAPEAPVSPAVGTPPAAPPPAAPLLEPGPPVSRPATKPLPGAPLFTDKLEMGSSASPTTAPKRPRARPSASPPVAPSSAPAKPTRPTPRPRDELLNPWPQSRGR